MDLPESVLNRFIKNHDDGCCAVDILEEGDTWMDVYETTHPVNSLLLYAVANILISKYVTHSEASKKNSHPQFIPLGTVKK